MYDIIIIGGGPAGLTAAIYASRFSLKTLIITEEVGGYMMESPHIHNYPGYTSISGIDLTTKMAEQVKFLNVKIVEECVAKIEKKELFYIKTKANSEFKAKSVVFAMGTKRRKLEIKGEDEFCGKGVSYCATCDAPLFGGRDVAVVGGANAAVVSALLLAKYAKSVHVIYRKEKLRADPYWVKKLEEFKNIQVHYNLNVKEIKGSNFVEKILLDNDEEINVNGVFIEIGSVPAKSLAHSVGVELSEDGCIIVDKTQKTNIDGVYAAGDLTTGSNLMRQIVTACAEGAIAAESIYHNQK